MRMPQTPRRAMQPCDSLVCIWPEVVLRPLLREPMHLCLPGLHGRSSRASLQCEEKNPYNQAVGHAEWKVREI